MTINKKTNIIAVFLMVVVTLGVLGFVLLPESKLEMMAGVLGITITSLAGVSFYTGRGGNGNQ